MNNMLHNSFVLSNLSRQRYKKPVETIWLKKPNKSQGPSLQTMLKVHKQNLMMPSLAQYTANSVTFTSDLLNPTPQTSTSNSAKNNSVSTAGIPINQGMKKDISEITDHIPAVSENKKHLQSTLSNGLSNGGKICIFHETFKLKNAYIEHFSIYCYIALHVLSHIMISFTCTLF